MRACDASCTGDYQCVQGACLPSSGQAQCPTQSLNLSLCVGRPTTSAVGSGAAAEPWVVLDSRLPEGLSFDRERGAVTGTAASAASGFLAVRRGPPGSEELLIDVTARERCPAIQTRALEACAGEVQRVSLSADPPGDYVWRVGGLPPGLVLEGGEISGRVAQPAAYPLSVTLLEGDQIRDEASLLLTVRDCAADAGGDPGADTGSGLRAPDADGPGTCDSLGGCAGEASTKGDAPVVDGCEREGAPASCPRSPLELLTRELPAVCAGEAYLGRLEAAGGSGDYWFQLLGEVPAGLALSEQGVLTGVALAPDAGEHRITVQLLSRNIDTPITATVRLRIEICDGLVYIADDTGVARLFLASASSGDVRELSAGVLTAGERVRSFLMAPGAPRLLFDVGAEGGAARLYWADLPSGTVEPVRAEPPLPSGAALIEYAWSLDGRHAASVHAAGDELWLGVAGADTSQLGPLIDVSDRYVSGLFWAAGRVCYTAPGPLPIIVSVQCHEVEDGVVEDQASSNGIFDALDFQGGTLVAGDEGYLTIVADRRRGLYYLPDAMPSSASHFDRVFSPGLHRVAGLVQGEAALSAVWTARGMPVDPLELARLEGCEEIQAWSLDERWIACRVAGELSIFELSPEGSLASGGRIAGSEGYASEESRRLFAPDGRWYAYVDGGALRVVPLDASERGVRLVAEGGAQAPYAGLATDASGAHLIYHHGSELDVIDMVSLERRPLSGAVELSDPPACTSSYLEAGPRSWCGAQEPPAFVMPSPDGRRVAFVDRQGELYVTELEAASAPRRIHAAAVKCRADIGETECDRFVRWAPSGAGAAVAP